VAKVLLHSLNFSPDVVSTGELMNELAEELKFAGHTVTVLTTTPHANIEQEELARQPLRAKWRGLLFTSDYRGIRVIHTSMPLKGSKVSARIVDYVRFAALSMFAGLTETGPYDVVLAVSPPLTIGLSGSCLAAIRRAPLIYNVQEIYPDIAVKLGVLSNRRVIRAMELLERVIYSVSACVVLISPWFQRELLRKGVCVQKVCVIPNHVDTQFIQPGEKNNEFSRKHHLFDKFVVLYAGNMGLTQSLEGLLGAAQRLARISDIQFVLIGGGARRGWVERQLLTGLYGNVQLLDFEPRSMVPAIYAASDVCLVPLKTGTARDTFPSKVYTIMAAGRPAISAADQDSELTWVIGEARAGWSVEPDDEVALARAIEYAYEHPEEVSRRGANGRKYVVEHNSRQSTGLRYSALIDELVAGRP
jgi:colanic acid biosynthesis glycosyl transferase WcaI